MPTSSGNQDDQDGLPPPGNRWGTGAQSVLPYLTKSLQARPSNAPEQGRTSRRDGQGRESHPVFSNWPPPPAG